jgi:hypothetical protein
VLLDKDGLHSAAPLPWVLPVGPQDVDYEYRAGAAPSTASIAMRFPALTGDQQARIEAFCTLGLLDQYRAMEIGDDSYFNQPRQWRLSVFDHMGERSDYFYRIEGDAIAALPSAPPALSWTTEIPAAKLYAGLALGESLTSMYLRINDMVFDDATEKQIASAEVVDDPLIRCLFNDQFGAYQAAQLRRLLG